MVHTFLHLPYHWPFGPGPLDDDDGWVSGTENDCRLFTTEMSILDYHSEEAVIKMCFQPRPIDTKNWGKFCMLVSQEAVARIWKPQENLRNYFKVSVKIKFTG